MKLIINLFFLSLFFSCQDFTKSQYISSYETFVKEESGKYASYSEEDKKKSQEKFKNFSETEYAKYKESFSAEERAKVNELTGRYAAILVKGEVGKAADELKKLLQQSKGVLEEISK